MDTEADADAGAYADTDADTDADAHTHTETDTCAATDTDTDTDCLPQISTPVNAYRQLLVCFAGIMCLLGHELLFSQTLEANMS